MANRQTVFYSWQSDTPASRNLTFIEKALHAAIERVHVKAKLIPALRNAVLEIDRDTKGVSGSPPITETILTKIASCSAFVADITFVGRSLQKLGRKPARLIPNPNVMIEYGHALKCVGHGRMIAVINTAFGDPARDNLPFDLRHLRWPIAYRYGADDEAEKQAIFDGLVDQLADALTSILDSQSHIIVEDLRLFTPHIAKNDPAIYFDGSEELIPEGIFRRDVPLFNIPEEGRGFLRLYPSREVAPLESELQARTLASQGGLRPIGLDVHGWTPARNKFGAIVYEGPINGKLFNFTQLFLNRELWGVDAFVVNATQCREFSPNYGKGYIASLFVERTFVSCLANYLQFCKDFLKLPLPLNIRVGLSGIQGYQMAVENGFAGGVLHDNIEWVGIIPSYDLLPHDILRPCFERIWQQTGLVRPEKYQQTLAKEFGTAA
jgi:hypothetical protein